MVVDQAENQPIKSTKKKPLPSKDSWNKEIKFTPTSKEGVLKKNKSASKRMLGIDDMKSEEPGADTIMKDEAGLNEFDDEEERGYVNSRIGKKVSEKKPTVLADYLGDQHATIVKKDPASKNVHGRSE